MSIENKRDLSEVYTESIAEEATTSKPKKAAKAPRPQPRKTAYTYWKQSPHGQAQGNKSVKEMRAIWNTLSDEEKEPFMRLAKEDLQRFKSEKRALLEQQENNRFNSPLNYDESRKKETKFTKTTDTLVPQSYVIDPESDSLTIYMCPSIHTDESPTESIVYGPLECPTQPPDRSFQPICTLAPGCFDIYHKRLKFQEDAWNDYLFLVPRKDIFISVQKHKEMFNYPSGVWFECNPSCPVCQSAAETYLIENSLNDWLLMEANFDPRKFVTELDTNKAAQYDEDHSVMRFCCYGHITFDFSFQVVNTQQIQLQDYNFALLPNNYGTPGAFTTYNYFQ